MTEFVISQELAQRLLDYLVRQPYGEVFQLVDALRTMKTLEKEDE